MDLASKGHIKPISPMTIFPFEDIVSAFRYMRGGNHVGKVVISNETTNNIKIPVSLVELIMQYMRSRALNFINRCAQQHQK